MSTSKEPQRPRPLTANALRNLIEIAISRGYFEESEHAEFEHLERNISTEDVLFALKRPDWIVKKQAWSEEYKNWKYLIVSEDIEGDELEVILAAYPNLNKVRIVTRW